MRLSLRFLPATFGLLVATGLLVAASARADDSLVRSLEVQLDVEQQMWDVSLGRLRELRRQEERHRARAAELAASLDAQLSQRGRLAPEQLEQLEDLAAVARLTAEELAEQAAGTRRSMIERWRRMSALEEKIAEARERPQESDPLSGLWRVVIVPSGSQGNFTLKLDGTLVSGFYTLDGGFHGSLRGTFVGRSVKLERIDAERGFDITYEGRLSADGARIDGAWRSTLLSGGGPAGGTWSARRQPPPEP